MDMPEVPLQQKLALLQDPELYGVPGPVSAIETHMSWVFLADGLAHKMKKPVKRPQLDFSSLALRELYCRAEVALNRRLSTNVYRGVVPLARRKNRFTLGEALDRETASGEVVEWLVAARRLNAELSLDQLLRRQEASSTHVAQLAAHLTGFYRSAMPAPLSPRQYLENLRRSLEQTVSELQNPAFELSVERVNRVAQELCRFLDVEAPTLERRLIGGKVIDAHGDLRPEHIYFEERPQVIDCLEFSSELRIMDLVDDLALLALECERLHAGSFGRAVVDACLAKMNDDAPARIVEFHLGRKALQRGMLAVWHNLEPGNVDRQKWSARALEYLTLAETAAGRL